MRTLDLISMLTNSSTPNCESQNLSSDSPESSLSRSNYYFKRTKEIKLEKENLLLGFKNKPVPVDETYSFDLNSNTNYLNLFLWTVQVIGKGLRKKNLLLGYVS